LCPATGGGVQKKGPTFNLLFLVHRTCASSAAAASRELGGAAGAAASTMVATACSSEEAIRRVDSRSSREQQATRRWKEFDASLFFFPFPICAPVLFLFNPSSRDLDRSRGRCESRRRGEKREAEREKEREREREREHDSIEEKQSSAVLRRSLLSFRCELFLSLRFFRFFSCKLSVKTPAPGSRPDRGMPPAPPRCPPPACAPRPRRPASSRPSRPP
jgi:hypothetical protein